MSREYYLDEENRKLREKVASQDALLEMAERALKVSCDEMAHLFDDDPDTQCPHCIVIETFYRLAERNSQYPDEEAK